QQAAASEAEAEKLQRAVHLIEAGEYKMAVHLLNELIQSAPNEARYYLYRGLAHQRQGHWGLAQMDYQGVLRLEPGNPSAEQGLREVEQQVGQEQVSPHPKPTLPTSGKPRQSKGLALVWLLANWAAAGIGYLGLGAAAPLLAALGSLQGAVAGASLGLGMGLLQWAVLRRQVSWRWVAATLLATALGWVAADTLAPQVGVATFAFDPRDPWPQNALQAMASPLRGLLVGLGVGGLQGILLSRHGKVAWAWVLAAGVEGGGAALLMAWLLAGTTLNRWLLLSVGLLANTRPLSARVLLNLRRVPPVQN
ncbi:tetratricopeptide repeat protein, partial [Synechococcus sp. H55.11]